MDMWCSTKWWMPISNERCRNLEQGPAKETVGSPDFIREVLLHPRLAGVIRSLLGPNFLMPTGGHHHLIDQPVSGQDWHSDGISGLGYEINELQCYYYPQDVNIEDGPTMILPGSHCRAVNRDALAHYGDLAGQLSLVVKAGTVAITRYGIWHRAGPKLNHKPRSMIKFSYFRNSDPRRRDWLIDSEEIPAYRDRPASPYTSGVGILPGPEAPHPHLELAVWAERGRVHDPRPVAARLRDRHAARRGSCPLAFGQTLIPGRCRRRGIRNGQHADNPPPGVKRCTWA